MFRILASHRPVAHGQRESERPQILSKPGVGCLEGNKTMMIKKKKKTMEAEKK